MQLAFNLTGCLGSFMSIYLKNLPDHLVIDIGKRGMT